MSAASEVIHSRICEESLNECLEWGGRCVKAAESLTEAGFAVVELPKPDKYNQWEIHKGPNHPFVYHDSGFDEIWYGSTVIDRKDARAVAAAILAAVDSADKADRS
jgi:hypothetical protein